MTSPLIETVRDIPLTERQIPLNEENSGFPFDDRDFDRGRSHHSSFRSQLDDIAKRHPEFAQHLNIGDDFPFRSHTLGRHRRGSDTEKPSGSQDAEFGRRHAAYDRPFSRFDHFDSPFRKYFEDDVPDFYEVPHQARHSYPDDLPEEPQQQHPHHHHQQQQKSQPSSPQPSTAEKPPQIPQNREGGRKQNIQQSNTVDLGQKQQPVDENRGQRSMSAPPENRSTGQRFVTSINIPIQRTGGGGGGDMGGKTSTQAQDQSAQQQSNKPNERVIPIHVEGRDEPIIPRNTTFSQAPPQPQSERIFGRNPGHFSQFLNKGEPHGMNPEDYYKQQQQQFQKQQEHQPQQQQPQQQYFSQQQEPQQQQQYFSQQQQPQQQHFPQQQQSQTQSSPPPQSVPQPQSQSTPQPLKPTQLDQIQNIQKDVSELMNQVEVFNGKPKDKQYIYLDEMLTRNLIKLDNIETEGKENIRQARKEAIKCIEGCIGILEAKANANLAVEIQNQHYVEEQKMETIASAETDKSKENEEQQQSENISVANEQSDSSMIKEQIQDANQTAALEVSGVTRTGSVVNVAPMEVTLDESKKEVPVPTPNETQADEKKEEVTLSPDAQENPEGNKDNEAKKDVEIKSDETKKTEDSKAEENVEIASAAVENTPQTATEVPSENASGEEKKEKKKGKKKEKTDKK